MDQFRCNHHKKLLLTWLPTLRHCIFNYNINLAPALVDIKNITHCGTSETLVVALSVAVSKSSGSCLQLCIIRASEGIFYTYTYADLSCDPSHPGIGGGQTGTRMMMV